MLYKNNVLRHMTLFSRNKNIRPVGLKSFSFETSQAYYLTKSFKILNLSFYSSDTPYLRFHEYHDFHALWRQCSRSISIFSPLRDRILYLWVHLRQLVVYYLCIMSKYKVTSRQKKLFVRFAYWRLKAICGRYMQFRPTNWIFS